MVVCGRWPQPKTSPDCPASAERAAAGRWNDPVDDDRPTVGTRLARRRGRATRGRIGTSVSSVSHAWPRTDQPVRYRCSRARHVTTYRTAATRATAAGWLATLCEHQGGVPFACLVSLRRGRDWSLRTGRLLYSLLTELGRHEPGVLDCLIAADEWCQLYAGARPEARTSASTIGRSGDRSRSRNLTSCTVFIPVAQCRPDGDAWCRAAS
jgi:hypothetical protein